MPEILIYQKENKEYNDLGAEFYNKFNKEKKAKYQIKKIEILVIYRASSKRAKKHIYKVLAAFRPFEKQVILFL